MNYVGMFNEKLVLNKYKMTEKTLYCKSGIIHKWRWCELYYNARSTIRFFIFLYCILLTKCKYYEVWTEGK